VPERRKRAAMSARRRATLAIVILACAAAALFAAPAGAQAATGSIAGTVTDAVSSAAIEGIEVCAEPASNPGITHHCGSTDASGGYAIAGLDEGSYVVHFKGASGYVEQYYDDEATFHDAQAVAVAGAASLSGVDAALVPGGRIAGQVTEAGTGTPAATVEVCATLLGTSFFAAGRCTQTDSGGSYAIHGLPAGSYEVRFRSWSAPDYLPQYYAGEERESGADVVEVRPGETVGSVDAAMRPGGTIAGTVTADASGSLQGIEVCAREVDSNSSECASTGADGRYEIGNLAGGSYRVQFRAGSSGGNYAPQFYSGEVSGGTADPVAVTPGRETAGVDAAMEVGGVIAGAVTAAGSHDPIQGVRVCLVGYEPTCAVTDSAGRYEIQDLSTGSYRLRISPGESGFLPQYYAGKETEAEAEPVEVTAGETTGSVDVAMVAGGSISGTVTDAVSHAGVELVRVCAFAVSEGESGRCAHTDSAGHYTIVGVRAGTYAIRFSVRTPETGAEASHEPAYATQFYDGKAMLSEADPVVVHDGAATSGVDAEMAAGGKVSGRVTAVASGLPLRSAWVCAYLPGEGGWEEHCAYSDYEGDYLIEGLASGEYTVHFSQGLMLWESRNYLSQTVEAVAVVAGSTHDQVDAALPTGGQISGHVSDAATGKSLGGVQVCALQVSGGEHQGGCAVSTSVGSYLISQLPSGLYQVEFSDLRYPYREEPFTEDEEPTPEELYVRQFWNGSAGAGSATPVEVVAGSVVGGIDAALVPGGSPAGGSEAGGGSGETPGGGSGGEGTIAAAGSTQAAGTAPPGGGTGKSIARKAPRHLRCGSGYKRRKVHGKVRCVRAKHHRKRAG